MADQFGLTDDLYLTDAMRGTAADLSRAFDSSRAIQERTMSRYGMPALSNFERDWAIERAKAMADRTNRIRMLKSAQQPTSGSTTGTSTWRDTLGGLAQLAPYLMGRNGFTDLMNKGIIGYAKDAFGNITAVPGVAGVPASTYDGMYTQTSQQPASTYDGMYTQTNQQPASTYDDFYQQSAAQPASTFDDFYQQNAADTAVPDFSGGSDIPWWEF